MADDWFSKMFDDFGKKREADRNREQIEHDTHEKIVLLIPDFWASICDMVEKRLKAFNERVGKDNEFVISHPEEYHLEATKSSYPTATLRVGIVPALAHLSFSGKTERDQIDGRYTLRLDDGHIYLEKLADRLAAKKAHITIEALDREMFASFLASVLDCKK